MLTLITGHTGSGKTYTAVKKLLEDLQKDRLIFTNIKLNLDAENLYFLADDELQQEFKKLAQIMRDNPIQEVAKEKLKQHKFANSAIYVDEAHFLGFRNKDEYLNDFLTIHRHMGLDIYLITQTPTNVYKAHLELVHKHIQCLPPSSRVMPNILKRRIYEPYGSKDFETKHEKVQKEIFELYNAGKKETSINKTVIKLMLGLLAVLLILFFVYTKFSSVLFNKDVKVVADRNKTKSVFISKDSNFTDLNISRSCTIISKVYPFMPKLDNSILLVEPKGKLYKVYRRVCK